MRTGSVSPMLDRLADERATGVLVRDHGALYLADGQVVHAESPEAPGLDVLLAAGGRLPREGWEDAVHQAGARHSVGRFLVDSGQVPGGELEICHLGALFDAAYFALAPTSGPSRFRYGVVHWIGPLHPVSTGVVEREALRRRRLLDSVWPWPAIDTAPVRHRASAGAPPIPRRQRALLDLADGVRTPACMARLLGRPAFNTMLEVRRLAAAGLVETPAEPPSPEQSAPYTFPAWVADLPSAVPDSAVLHRLRDALEEKL